MKQNRPVITLHPSGHCLKVKQHAPSLLALLELHHLPVESQCRAGYCGACRTKLIKGSVVYHRPPLAALNQGEILPCCCSPTTDIEVELELADSPLLTFNAMQTVS